jgi:hypothetical protein
MLIRVAEQGEFYYLILVAEVSVYTTPVPNKLKLRKKPQNRWLFSPAHVASNDCLSVASVVPAQFLLASSLQLQLNTLKVTSNSFFFIHFTHALLHGKMPVQINTSPIPKIPLF